MSEDVERPRVESKWKSVLEYAMFGFPAMVGVAVLITFSVYTDSLSGGDFFPRLLAVLFLVSLVGGFVLSVLVAVSVYFDAKRVERADTEWSPSPVVYAIVGFFLSGLAALAYLYERYEYTAPPPTYDWWWYGVAACLAVVVVTGVVGVLPVSTATGTAVTVVVSGSVLPVVIYKDAVHVRSSEREWLPNPVSYFLAVLVGSVLPLVSAAVTGYYLYKRHEHVGVP